jgi:diphthamide biosynthesis protein 3|eukprot:149985_1
MSIYEEVEIEDLDYDPVKLMFTYPCPCGDKFRISLVDLWDGEDIAPCPSCTLRIEIIYDEEDLPELPEGYEESGSESEDEVDSDAESEKTKSSQEELTKAVKTLSV